MWMQMTDNNSLYFSTDASVAESNNVRVLIANRINGNGRIGNLRDGSIGFSVTQGQSC